MLFELLVGRLPIDPTQQGMHAFMARLAAGDTSPPTPSAKLMMLGDEGTLVAETRRTVPAALRRQLRGDLDWIVMKAMEPDRSHRYETANGLASDLRRHLAHEPVIARPRSTRYRVRKFVRRHRTGVITAGAVSVAVLASAIQAVVGFVRATQAEHARRRRRQRRRPSPTSWSTCSARPIQGGHVGTRSPRARSSIAGSIA
jgi:non-specific serine/threonine protein kinase/serine/threonine-protein kinase